MKLELGKYYRDGLWEVHGPVKENTSPSYNEGFILSAVQLSNGRAYSFRDDGRFAYKPCENDLVEEVANPEEVKHD